VLTDEATLSVTLSCLLEHLSIPIRGDCTPQNLFEILIRAATQQGSSEQTTRHLMGVPTGNTIRYHLEKLNEMAVLDLRNL
jgi:putative transposase